MIYVDFDRSSVHYACLHKTFSYTLIIYTFTTAMSVPPLSTQPDLHTFMYHVVNELSTGFFG